jgi:hypothetical protein
MRVISPGMLEEDRNTGGPPGSSGLILVTSAALEYTVSCHSPLVAGSRAATVTIRPSRRT